MTKEIGIQDVWISNAKNGDEIAAMHLYNSYSKAMYNTLIRISGNSIEAQDLLQEAFIKAFSKLDSFRGESTFGAWLKRIVVNTGLEHLRKKKVNFDSLDENVFENTPEEPSDDLEYESAIIHESIKQLPSGSRTVLTLFLMEGYTHKEIADELNISESTSKTQYMRGKQLLKTLLKDKLYE